MNDSAAAAKLVASLQARVEETLDRCIPRDVPLALVNFPNHGNVGDSAIWLGTKAALRRLGRGTVYETGAASYDQRALAARVRDGVILFHGGGNLGDLWPREQLFRERILQDFPNNRILQLPQTITFREEGAAARFRDLCRRHGGFSLLVRDLPSGRAAAELLGLEGVPCPDLAFALGPLGPRSAPSIDILWQNRSDAVERMHHTAIGDPRVALADWHDAEPKREVVAGRRRLAIMLALRRSASWLPWPDVCARVADSYERLAQVRLNGGLALLSRGRVVITDRLYGHILCLLLGIPHVVLDTRYGKNSAALEAWTGQSGIAHLCAQPAEALACAQRMLKGLKS